MYLVLVRLHVLSTMPVQSDADMHVHARCVRTVCATCVCTGSVACMAKWAASMHAPSPLSPVGLCRSFRSKTTSACWISQHISKMAAKFRRSVARGLATKGKFKKKPARAGSTSWARLSIFNKGVVWGMHVAGLKRSDMAAHVQKTDGSKPHLVNGQRTCAVNVQSTYSQRTVNIQSTYSQHTVNTQST